MNEFEIGEGLEVQQDGTAKVVDASEAWRSISSDVAIDYIYIEPSPSEGESQTIRWTVATQKPTDSDWYVATSVVGYSTSSQASRYSHIGGGATQVRFTYQVNDGDVIPLSDITVNPNVPFRLDFIRIGLEILIWLIIVIFRPESFIYRKRFGENVLFENIGICLAAVVQVIFLSCVWYMSGGTQSDSGQGLMSNGSMFDFDQYAHLADALLRGRVNLDLPVNSDLAQMQNPYDYTLRTQVAQTTTDNTPIYFDVAFKDGKYYCYFGVLPAILLFIPCKLLTGGNLSVGTAIIILDVLVVAAATLAVVQLARFLAEHNVHIKTGVVILAVSVLSFGLPLTYTIQHRLFYQIPQTLGLVCVFTAIACWYKSKRCGLNKVWLSLGSLLMAMSLGCRPQLILSAILAIPIFGEDILEMWHQGRMNRSGAINEIKTWVCALAPFVIVFIPLLAYNYARFGNPFDFGANYNLTGYDMTHNHLPWTLLIPLIFLYFFQPPNVTLSFPFLSTTSQEMPLWLPMQPSYGGYFMLIAPFTVVILLLWAYRRELKIMNLLPLTIGLSVYLITIFVFDVHMVGYDVRYILDFGWSIVLLFAVVMFAITGSRDIESTSDIEGCGDMAEAPRLVKVIIGITVMLIVVTWVLAFLHVVGLMSSPLGSQLWWRVYSWFLFV